MNAIWNKDMECMSRRDLEALQLERLKALVDYCDRNVEFYHKRLEAAGVTADKIKVLSDVQYIPYTTKADLRDTYPFGMFSVPRKELVRVHASSGTTGNPTVVGYTREDLDNWAEQVARVVVAAGASCAFTLPSEYSTMEWMALWGCTTDWSASAPRWCPPPPATPRSS